MDNAMNRTAPTVSVVIVNHNGRKYLGECLASLHALDYPQDRLEIIIVDNASTNNDIQWVSGSYPKVRLLPQSENLGFARGINRGSATAAGEYLAFLNPDMRVNPQWLEALIATIRSEAHAVCAGSIVLNWEGDRIDYAGRPNDALNLFPTEPIESRVVLESPRDAPLFFASGGAMAIRRDIFEQMGGFDEDYFLYHEDVDLGWRLWAQGYRVLRSFSSVAYHASGSSSKKLPRELVAYWAQKYALLTALRNLENAELSTILPRIIFFLVARAHLWGIGRSSLSQVIQECVSEMDSIWAKRVSFQHERVRSDADVFAECGHPFGALLKDDACSNFQDYLEKQGEALVPSIVDAPSLASYIVHVAYHAYAFNSDLLPAQLAEQESRVKDLVAQVTERQQAVESVAVQLSESNQKVQALVAQVGERQQAVESLTAQVIEKEHAIQTLSVLVGEKQLAVQALTAQVADREQLALQLNAIYSSKLWKLGTAYRALYEPFRAQIRRLATSRPRQWLAALRARKKAGPTTSLASVPVEIDATSKLDVICFSASDWNSRHQYPRQILTQFARDGHRVFYLSPHFAGAARAEAQARSLTDRVYELVLPDGGNISKGTLAGVAQDKSLDALRALIRQQNIAEAICLVQHPFWTPLARALRERFGWKIIYDCMSDRRDLPATRKDIEALEIELVRISDLVVTTAQPAYQRLHQTHPNCVLVPNAGDKTEQQSRETQYHILQSKIETQYAKASIIIVTWNNLDLTRQCIASVLADKTWPNFEIVIVDNASSDGTVEYLKALSEKEPHVAVIFKEENVGFVAANNIGIQNSQESEFVILLNNDTVVPRGWLARLLRHARRPEIGIVGPVTNWTGNEAKIDVTYSDLRDMESFAASHVAAHEGEVFDIRVTALYCAAMRKSVVDQVGPFDERFQVGMFEDDDYARRVRQAGYRVICAEDVFVHHHGNASFAKLSKPEYLGIFEMNKRLYEEKWGGPWTPHKNREQVAAESEGANYK